MKLWCLLRLMRLSSVSLGAAEELVAEGYQPLADLMSTFINNGGKIWLCPGRAKATRIAANDLIAGAEIAGAPKTMAFLASGAQLLA